MKRLFSTTVVVLLLCVLPGCISKQAALSKSTTPIATNIHGDMTDYIAELPPGQQQDEQRAKNDAYLFACQRGELPAIVDTWYGGATGQGIRLWYTNYLYGDPKYDQPWGADVRQMKLRNITVFDYLLTVGEPPPP